MDRRIVGWTSNDEWLKIYELLFYGDTFKRFTALNVINVWRSRFGSRIPVAIEATSRLVEAWLEKDNVSLDGKRQILSAAITQFVGLMTERGLKGNTKKPIHEIGEDLGIPEWLINLRHEMAHGPLPSLLMLEKAVLFALDWLKDNHWDKHLKKMSDLCSNMTPVDSDISILSLLYDIVSVLSKKSEKAKTKKVCVQKLSAQIEAFLKSDENAERFCVLLVEHNFLEYYPGFADLTSDVHLNNYSKYFEHWQFLFELIVQYRRLPIFLHLVVSQLGAMVKKRHNQTSVLEAWCSKILQALVKEYGNDYDASKDGSQGVWNRIIKFLVLNSKTREIASIFNQLSVELPGVFANNHKLLKLFEIVSETNVQCDKSFDCNYHSVVTVNDLLSKKSMSDLCETSAHDLGFWKVEQDMSLSEYPIGLLPGQTKQFLLKCLISHTNFQKTSGIPNTEINVIDCSSVPHLALQQQVSTEQLECSGNDALYDKANSESVNEKLLKILQKICQ